MGEYRVMWVILAWDYITKWSKRLVDNWHWIVVYAIYGCGILAMFVVFGGGLDKWMS